jgi:hypothetical protein
MAARDRRVLARTARALLVLTIVAAPVACERCGEREEEEEEEAERDNLWRVQVTITGQGSVATQLGELSCASDGARQTGRCGPLLLRFKERVPPLLRATAAPGFRFDHWESLLRARDGSAKAREGRMPDGPLYLNGMGYKDTGVLETVTPVFVRVASDAGRPGQLGVQP